MSEIWFQTLQGEGREGGVCERVINETGLAKWIVEVGDGYIN